MLGLIWKLGMWRTKTSTIATAQLEKKARTP